MDRILGSDTKAREKESALETESPLTLYHFSYFDPFHTLPCGIAVRRAHQKPCIPRLWVELRRRLRSAEMAAAYPRAHHPVGDDVRRLSLCLCSCHVRPTKEVRVSSPRLLQRETEPRWPSASEHSKGCDEGCDKRRTGQFWDRPCLILPARFRHFEQRVDSR